MVMHFGLRKRAEPRDRGCLWVASVPVSVGVISVIEFTYKPIQRTQVTEYEPLIKLY